ncbi:MAG: LacI family DNA-binding transcriptional regulator [Verrucomicrobiota bacterium JB022]|nr:LacI family DNA-binding transcriptional regulator [Verrucomicrobiota bacterium JB022]
MSKKRISQTEIAQQLGVSQTLVSMALNGRTSEVAKATYDRIWAFAMEHGYSPRGMKIKPLGEVQPQPFTMGYVLRSPIRMATKSNFFSHVTQGMHEYLSDKGLKMTFLGSESDFSTDNPPSLEGFARYLQGIAVMGQVQPEFLDLICQLKRPIAMVSARAPGICHSVNSNERQAADLLVGHLYNLGHREFAFFSSRATPGRHLERYEALLSALRARGINLKPENLLLEDEAERRFGYQAAEKVLAREPSQVPTAWVFQNGLMARGAVNRLFQAQIRLGAEVSVAAFDRTRVMEEEIPGITGAAARPEDLGREVARILLESAQDEDSAHAYTDLVLPAELTVRETTGAPVGLRARA